MKNKAIKLCLIIAFTVFSIPSFADGNKLLEYCQMAEQVLDNKPIANELSVGLCLGLVKGVLETINNMQLLNKTEKNKVCFPDGGIMVPQAVRITNKYLKEHPNLLHEPETILVLMALVDAFPCGSK